MNKRDTAVVAWCQEHNSSATEVVEGVIGLADGVGRLELMRAYLCVTVAFEAGRDFQKKNPNAPDGPSAYL